MRTQHPPLPPMHKAGAIWNSLQDLKEEVSKELVAEGPLCHTEILECPMDEAATASAREIEWIHRGQLEERLATINDAQDRLLNGTYGLCAQCNKRIAPKRLAADPVVQLCYACQQSVEEQGESEMK